MPAGRARPRASGAPTRPSGAQTFAVAPVAKQAARAPHANRCPECLGCRGKRSSLSQRRIQTPG
eukprot:5390581-Pyramimonas_sp.AAC.1